MKTSTFLAFLPALVVTWGTSCARNDVSIERTGRAAETGGGPGFGGTSGDSFGGSGAVADASVDVAIETPDAAQPFTRAALLEAFGQCALAHYRVARDTAADLVNALNASENDPHDSRAREAWMAMIDVWQQAEVMQFGPTAAAKVTIAGRDLRNQIYSWPSNSPCEVDKQIVSKGYESPSFANSQIRVRTLSALEYLIFHSGSDNRCSPSLPINTSGSWAALGPDLGARRLAYARAVAKDVLARTQTLVDAWDPQGQNFYGTFVSAGNGSSVYANDRDAFNDVTSALWYIELEVKDSKLAQPLGKQPLCTEPPCLDYLESQFASRSKAHIRNNLIGFKKLFAGCGPSFSGFGFDDLLVANGERTREFAEQMNADIDRAIAAGDAIEESDLALALQNDYASVDDWYNALKRVTDALKTEFVGLLSLETPARAPGEDND